MPAPDRIMEKLLREEKMMNVTGVNRPTISVDHVVHTDKTIEVSSSPPPTKPDVVAHNRDLREITQPPAPKPKLEKPDYEVANKIIETARASQSQTAKKPTDENLANSYEANKALAHWYRYRMHGSTDVEEKHTNESQDLVKKIADTLGGIGRAIVDGATSVANGIAAFGRGIWYGIVGPPPDEDLSDEIAALKGVGFALMSGGGAVAAGAAATGLGLPVAGAAGAASLIGWALTDNFAGRLEFIQSQREAEKRRKKEMEEMEEAKRRQREEDIKAWEQFIDRKLAKEKEALEARRKELEEMEREREEKRQAERKEWEEYMKKLEEERRKRREEEAKFWKEIEEERRKTKEQKDKEEEEDRRFNAVLTGLRGKIEDLKNTLQAASTAWFAKNYDVAKSMLDQSAARIPDLKNFLESNREILEKYDYYAAFMDHVRSIENAIEADRKAWSGKLPNDNLVNASINYTNSTYQFNHAVQKHYVSKGSFSVHRKDDVEEIHKALRIQRKNYALGHTLAMQAKSWLDRFPILTYQPSKLSPETIVKFRVWLRKTLKTPLAKIPNSRWNMASGYKYTPYMFRLMYQALKEAGVDLEDVATLKPRELEAILRARQYLYNAAKRGYWHPYELELYTRLKELLQLTDGQVEKLFRLELPEITMGAT
jgi:hypothetical protein